jgi:hypothetical protein
MNKVCEFCSNNFEAKLVRAKYCSNKCRTDNFYKNNKEHVSLVSKKYRDSNKKLITENKKTWQEENKEWMSSYWTDWSNKNKHIRCANEAKYRAAKLNATPKWLTINDHNKIEAIYGLASTLQRLTGIKFQVDHIIPLQGKEVRGLHVPWNLQILTKYENISKGNRL